MEKFISKDSFLISLSGIVGIDQTADTTTLITYADGLIATVTHGTSGTNPAFFNELVIAIEKALQTPWTEPIYEPTALEVVGVISGIVYTHTVVPVV